jgi:hypothetical protein
VDKLPDVPKRRCGPTLESRGARARARARRAGEAARGVTRGVSGRRACGSAGGDARRARERRFDPNPEPREGSVWQKGD